MNWLGLGLAIALFLMGLAGTIVPMLPGAPLIYIGFIVFGLFNDFTVFSTWFWIGELLLLILTLLIDYISGAVGTKKFGGSKAGVWGSVIGSIAGLFVLPPVGLLVGPIIGATIGELLNRRPLKQAIRIGFGSFIGLAGGVFGKIICELSMIIWFMVIVL